MVQIRKRKIVVLAYDAMVIVSPVDGEDIKELRNRIYELVRGTPAKSDRVIALLKLCL